ncbi:MAG: sensor domain-containing protein [Mycolicibacterium sp.]|uniref:sensor domain-containing protein n=1 Tax=Mycolicibacterium sp. TaxID=2320850 RepID=UPI003D1167C1
MAGAGSARRVAGAATGTAVAVLGAALVGCAGSQVDQRPVIRIVEAAQPLAAMPLGDFLPTMPELAAQLGTGPDGFLGQPVEGGAEMLLRNVDAAAAAPAECVSTAYRLQKVVYQVGPVRSVASGSWAGGGFEGPPVSGFFGIVQMASAAEAQTFFATMSDNWRRCNGRTVALQPGPGAEELTRIADVALDARLVSANVLHASGGGAAVDVSRAIGLAGDCIVDVEITDPRASGEAAPAVRVAGLMLDKIAAGR